MYKYISAKAYSILLALMIIAGCTSVYHKVSSPDFEALYGPSNTKQRILTHQALEESLARKAVSYHQDIKPILDSCCVACHACYDAPSQLKLNSTAGQDRGATKQTVYDGSRLNAVDPTRLFIDATNTEGWRKKEFYSKFGISRTNPEFWEYADWFNAQHKKDRGVQAGLFDLNRYHNL